MTTEKGIYLLVITPHPDDAEFGIAGTVARLTAEGRKVVYVVCTNGDKGSSDPAADPVELARTRQKEQQAAADLLGVKEVIFLGYPDQGLEDTPEFRRDLVRVIRKYRPEIVAGPDPYRRYIWHRDHRITARAMLDAVFPYARDPLSYPELLEEGLEPHKVHEVWCWAPEKPNYRLDITATFDIKMKALALHESQIAHVVSPEWNERMIKMYTKNAAGEDFDLAEAFYRVEIPY